jgi:carbamoyl-phosphate synthase large subunit
VRILLTGVGCPGAHALISNLKLQDENIFILGTNADEQAIGRWLCNEFAVVPWAYEENYVDSIIDLVKKNKIDIVFPQTSWEMFHLSKAANKIQKYCKLLASSHELVAICENKYLMYKHFEGKLDVPEFYLVKTMEELEEAATKLGYPEKDVVFKPPEGKGARGVRILTEKSDRYDLLFNGRPFARFISMEELKSTVQEKEIPPLMIMEYLEGDELKIDPVLKNGEILVCSVKHRLNFDSGLAMGFEIIEDKEAIEYSKTILEHLPMDYCIDISTRGGVLMEINPRVSTFIYDENYCAPYLSLKLAMGEMSAADVRSFQKNLPLGKKMFRYYGQRDY